MFHANMLMQKYYPLLADAKRFKMMLPRNIRKDLETEPHSSSPFETTCLPPYDHVLLAWIPIPETPYFKIIPQEDYIANAEGRITKEKVTLSDILCYEIQQPLAQIQAICKKAIHKNTPIDPTQTPALISAFEQIQTASQSFIKLLQAPLPQFDTVSVYDAAKIWASYLHVTLKKGETSVYCQTSEYDITVLFFFAYMFFLTQKFDKKTFSLQIQKTASDALIVFSSGRQTIPHTIKADFDKTLYRINGMLDLFFYCAKETVRELNGSVTLHLAYGTAKIIISLPSVPTCMEPKLESPSADYFELRYQTYLNLLREIEENQ